MTEFHQSNSDALQPTPEEITQAADVLHRLPKGFLPFELFIAIAEKITTPVIELAPLRRNADGQTEILLTQRPADDPHWPGGWHMPGTVLRSTDSEGDFSTGIERILQKELHGSITMLGEPVTVGTKFWDIKRGRELDTLLYFETDTTDGDVVDGHFFLATDLPELTLEHHKIMIPEIVAVFEQQAQ